MSESDFVVAVEDAGPARKHVKITLPAEKVASRLGDALGDLAANATLPGFRRGHAPAKLLEKRFGGELRKETRDRLIQEGFQEAVGGHGLRPVGDPMPVGSMAELEVKDGEDFSFELEIEVIPDFELPETKGFKIDRPVMEVTDEHVDGEIERQCIQAGTVLDVEDVEVGDRLLGNGHATKEGEAEPFFTHDNIDIIVPDADKDDGRGHVLGLRIEGLAGMLDGAGIGSELNIDAVGPEHHELEHIRGKQLTISLTIHKIQRIESAEVSDVYPRYGFTDEETFRSEVRRALDDRLQGEQRNAMREQAAKQLADSVDFELPERLTEQQSTRLIERERMNLLQRGALTNDEIEGRLADLRDAATDETRRRLKLSFLLARLAESKEIQVNEGELNSRIHQMAASQGMRPEQVKGELEKSGGLQNLAMQVREQKVLDGIVDEAELTDISAEEWNARTAADKA